MQKLLPAGIHKYKLSCKQNKFLKGISMLYIAKIVVETFSIA